MLRITSIITLALLLVAPAEARHRQSSPAPCIETGTLMAPACMGQAGNPFSGARSMRITMKRERPQRLKRRVVTVLPSIGLVRASSGAVARVAAHATEAFQCIVNRLEQRGYPVRFMGGLSSGHMRNSLHHVGLALDVNQVARNVTKPRMPGNEIELANSCGLVSGAQWRNADSGHFQLGGYTGRTGAVVTSRAGVPEKRQERRIAQASLRRFASRGGYRAAGP